MQPNVITLAVDVENSGSTADQDYTRFEEYLNRSVYVADGHALDARNTLGLYRTVPKPNGNFKGVAKTSMKFTEDVTVVGSDGSDLTAPIIVEVGFSVPVGALASKILEIRQRALALLDRDDIMTPLNSTQMV